MVREVPPTSHIKGGEENRAKTFARFALIGSSIAIATAYGSAFQAGGAPRWAAWLLALAIPTALVAVMVMGAVRERTGLKQLAIPFAFVGILLATAFCLALALPANESAQSRLFFGLPLRAALIVYGVGLMPTLILPIVYALTFESQTLTAEDVAKVRELGAAYAKRGDNQPGTKE